MERIGWFLATSAIAPYFEPVTLWLVQTASVKERRQVAPHRRLGAAGEALSPPLVSILGGTRAADLAANYLFRPWGTSPNWDQTALKSLRFGNFFLQPDRALCVAHRSSAAVHPLQPGRPPINQDHARALVASTGSPACSSNMGRIRTNLYMCRKPASDWPLPSIKNGAACATVPNAGRAPLCQRLG